MISPISVPIGTVPITFSLLVIMLASIIIGPLKACVSSVLYLLIGICGLPVFSLGGAGVGTLLNLTGGFLISYPLVALISGAKIKTKNRLTEIVISFLMCLISLSVCYFLGSLWYGFLSENSLSLSLKTFLSTFLLFDILKCLVASVVGVEIKSVLKKSHLI